MSPARDVLVADAAEAYLGAHAALVAAGVGPDRPQAAQALADAWLRLTRAVEARRKSREAARG